jgi:hypothetical protein
VVSAALNLVPAFELRQEWTWQRSIHLFGATTTLLALAGSQVREAFVGRPGVDELWRSENPTLKALRLCLFTNLFGVPALLLYSWSQPVVAETASWAVILAIVVGLGLALTLARKVVGALLLVLGGVGVLGQAITTLLLASRSPEADVLLVAGYYAVFWTPAAFASIYCGIRLVRPVAKLLRGR